MRSVIAVQAPRPAITRSYGAGPPSAPPSETGSSATSWCPAPVSICVR